MMILIVVTLTTKMCVCFDACSSRRMEAATLYNCGELPWLLCNDGLLKGPGYLVGR